MERRHHSHRSNGLTINLLAAALATALGASAAAAQTWSGGTPYGGDVRTLAQSAANPDRLFASTAGGFFRSDDGGAHWARKLADMGSLRAGRITGVAVPDALPGRVYVSDAAGWIYRSDDDGESFVAVYRLTTLPGDITGLFAAPGSGDRVYAATYRSGLWYSEDAGASFAHADAGMDPPAWITKVVFPSTPQGIVIALSGLFGDPIYYSFVGANGWLANRDLGSLGTAAATAGNYAYIGAIDLQTHSGLYLNLGMGTLWNRQPFGCDYDYIQDIALDANANPEWLACRYAGLLPAPQNTPIAPPLGPDGQPAAIRQILRDRADPMRLWAASENSGVFISTDKGLTWRSVNDGLVGSSFRSVAVDPRRPQRIFAGYINESTDSAHPGLLVSNDAGAHWEQSDAYRLTSMLRGLAIDPTTTSEASSTVLYATGNYSWGIYKSLDGGAHWAALFPNEDDLEYSFFRDLVLDKRSCANPPASGPCSEGPLRSFYAVGTLDQNLRVIRGNGDGTGVTGLGGGLPATINTPETYERIDTNAIALDPNDSNRVYVATFLSWSPKVTPALPPQLDNGVFRSDDAGATWIPVNEDLPHQTGSAKSALDIYALATHPSRSGTLWATGSFKNGDEGSRVFRSDDAGAHWQEQIVSAECDLRRLLVDPTAPDIVYASGRLLSQGSGCVLRSEDGGAHWTRVDAALPATSVMAMAQVPNEHGHLVVGTNGGVWHLHDNTDRMFDSGFD